MTTAEARLAAANAKLEILRADRIAGKDPVPGARLAAFNEWTKATNAVQAEREATP